MSRFLGWTFAAAACTVIPVPARAQQGPVDSVRSSLSGVFTEEQAGRGKQLYLGRCKACHTPAAHAGTFKTAFAGRALVDPFEYISENMPKDAPGTLNEGEVTSVLTYFLQLLGNPAGATPLTPDLEALAAIRLDAVTTNSPQTEEKKP